MQTLLSRVFLFFHSWRFHDYKEKRANVINPKTFDVFFSDCLKSLINIHEKIVALAASQAGRASHEVVLQVWKRFGALEAPLKTLGRRTAKEKGALQLQREVRTVSLKDTFV